MKKRRNHCTLAAPAAGGPVHTFSGAPAAGWQVAREARCRPSDNERRTAESTTSATVATPVDDSLPNLLALLTLLALTAGCGPSPAPATTEFEGAEPVCQQAPAIPAASVSPNHATLGPASNAIRRGGDSLWIVVSGSNTVARLDPASGTLERDFIDVGNDRNPYDVTVDAQAERAFVTNWLSDTVSVADTTTGEVLAEIDAPAFDSPEGIAYTDDHLYVGNVQFSGGDDPFGPGSVSIVDRQSHQVVDTVETARPNPQFIRRIDTPRGPRIAVVDTGVITLDGADIGRSDGPAALELWEPGALTSETPASGAEANGRRRFPLPADPDGRVGAPGRPLPGPNGRYLYFTSATAPVVFKFDMHPDSTGWVRGTDNPIRLYETDSNALHHGTIGPRGYLWVTAFNRDALWVLDTRCDKIAAGPVSLGRTPDLVEGPHGIAFGNAGHPSDAYYIMSPGHALGRLTLD